MDFKAYGIFLLVALIICGLLSIIFIIIPHFVIGPFYSEFSTGAKTATYSLLVFFSLVISVMYMDENY